MANGSSKINNLDENQRVNYVKNLLFNHELNEALDILLKDENKNLLAIKTILNVLKDELIIERIKSQCNIKKDERTVSFVYSKIISILAFYNKSLIMIKFFKLLSEEEKKNLAYYEYQNKTNVSFSNKTFNRYFSKYKNEAIKQGELSDEEVLLLDDEIKKYNSISSGNNVKRNVFICLGILIIILLSVTIYEFTLVKKYNGLFYPGIYFNNINLSGKKISQLDDIINSENEKITDGKITISNVNGDYDYTYKELGITTNKDDVKNKIINYNKNLSLIDKLKMINLKKKRKVFYLKGTYDKESINKFVISLKTRLDAQEREDGLVVDDKHNVSYASSVNGFILDVDKTVKELEKSLKNLTDQTKVEAYGTVIKIEDKNKELASINTKIASYTTSFENVGNRGHNIVLAASKLNGTVLMKDDEFSYLKVVGPYSAKNGYLPAPAYVNKVLSTANGGGVCQLATTLYNAQLRANLETIYRINHSYAPVYVPKGLDATVYSTTTDYKFKNQYDYPVYITSYVVGGKLTVDIWSSDKTLGNKTYEPYSYFSNGGYVSYLKEFENGKYVSQKYLNTSYYKQ